MEFFSSYRAHKVKLFMRNAKNHDKSAILHFFSAITEIVWELFISNKFGKDTYKLPSYCAHKWMLTSIATAHLF